MEHQHQHLYLMTTPDGVRWLWVGPNVDEAVNDFVDRTGFHVACVTPLAIGVVSLPQAA